MIARWTSFLKHEYKEVNIIVEPEVGADMDGVYFFSPDWMNAIDLVITLGGDGTILHVNSLFTEKEAPSDIAAAVEAADSSSSSSSSSSAHTAFSSKSHARVPPVLSFSLMGSLGFLMPHDFGNYREAIRFVMKNAETGMRITYRTRIDTQLIRQHEVIASMFREMLAQKKKKKPLTSYAEQNVPCLRAGIKSANQVVNEVTIHRGSITIPSTVNCFVNGFLLTKFKGDG